MAHAQAITQSTQSQGLPEVLERVLDKGVVIMGDIKIKLCDVELLSIQIRLLVCSVDKAREMGVAWWEPAARPNQTVPQPHYPQNSMPAQEFITGAAQEQDLRFQQTMRAVEKGPPDAMALGRRQQAQESI
jgi:hypothetical protein